MCTSQLALQTCCVTRSIQWSQMNLESCEWNRILKKCENSESVKKEREVKSPPRVRNPMHSDSTYHLSPSHYTTLMDITNNTVPQPHCCATRSTLWSDKLEYVEFGFTSGLK